MSNLHYVPSCNSTNDLLPELISKGASFTGLYTFCQLQGRGTYGNLWEGSKEQNTALSIAMESGAFPWSGFLFNYRTARLVRDYLASTTGLLVELKWPNDLVVGGKKVGGILIEKISTGSVPYYIIGIGINVLQKKFLGLPQASSLSVESRREFELHAFTKGLYEHLVNGLTEYVSEEDIMEDFNCFLFRRDQVSVFESPNGIRQNGIIRKALVEGTLLVELEHCGSTAMRHKEYKLLY